MAPEKQPDGTGPVPEALYIGLDAGGSHTRALLGTADGGILASAETEGANPNLCGRDVALARLGTVLDRLAATAAARGARLAGVFACVAGAGTGGHAAALEAALRVRQPLAGAAVRVTSDAEAAFASAPEAPDRAVCVILGTGFCVFGRTGFGAPLLRACGWGARFDGVAGGYGLGRILLREVLREEDALLRAAALGRTPPEPSPLVAAAWHLLPEGGTVHDALPRLLTAPPADIAAFSRLLADETACPPALRERLFSEMADEVAAAIRALSADLDCGSAVILAGGISEAAFPALSAALSVRLPDRRFYAPTLPPVEGALRLAIRTVAPDSVSSSL